MKVESLYRLVCRPALPKDTRDVLALTARIWDGHDYVPEVWGDWLADPEGMLAVAEYGGRVVGLYKLSYLTPEDGWLHGLRVDPDYQGRGFARHLHEYILRLWQVSGGGKLRLATSAKTQPTQHLCDQTGFEKLNEIMGYSAPALDEPFMEWEPLQKSGAAQALETARASPTMHLCRWVIDLIWEWASLTLAQVEKAAEEGRAWSHPHSGSWFAAAADEDEGRRRLFVQMVACPLSLLPACLLDLRRLAHLMGLPQVRWGAPLRPEIEAALQLAGYQRDWENPLYLYEKTLPDEMQRLTHSQTAVKKG